MAGAAPGQRRGRIVTAVLPGRSAPLALLLSKTPDDKKRTRCHEHCDRNHGIRVHLLSILIPVIISINPSKPKKIAYPNCAGPERKINSSGTKTVRRIPISRMDSPSSSLRGRDI
jgi:hypothetical protein